MKKVNTEIQGRKYVVLVDDDETDYTSGLVIGPPDLDSLELSEEILTTLHNELFHRGLITKQDVMKRRQEVLSALQFAFSVNVDTIINLYK